MVEYYDVLKLPLLAFNLAASRVPRLQKYVPAEFRDNWVSPQVARSEWNVDPADGKQINSAGQTLEEYLEFWLKSRPHAFEPVILEEPEDDLWTTGNITRRGARFKELKAFCGSDAAALVLLKEEAAAFGVTNPLSTQIGEKVDPKANKKPAGSSSNPWDAKNWRGGDEDARQAKIQSIIRDSTERARTLSKAAGMKLDGTPLGVK